MNRRKPLPWPMSSEIFLRKSVKDVKIMHPGSDDPLFMFPALSTGSFDTPFGVFLPLVLDACRVLTNHAANDKEHFLASDREGRKPVGGSYVCENCYYFLGPPKGSGVGRGCPVVKTFRAFTFPPALPTRWSLVAEAFKEHPHSLVPVSSSPSEALAAMLPMACNVTRSPKCTHHAHLIPKAQEEWFAVNHMQKYLVSGSTAPVNLHIDHPSNRMYLRSDVHLCFDELGFVFYPDKGPSSSPSPDDTFIMYFLKSGWPPEDKSDLLHRREVVIQPDVSIEFLYARFAYAVINLSLSRENLYILGIPEPPAVTMSKGKRRGWAVPSGMSGDVEMDDCGSSESHDQDGIGSGSENGGSGNVVIKFAETAMTMLGENVFVVGSIAQLGNWDPASAIARSAASYPVWTASVTVPAGTSFEYKFIRKETDGSVVWESDPNRSDTAPSSGSQTLTTTWR